MKKYAVALFPVILVFLANTAFADLDEDIKFGKGLADKKYPHLAIQVLEPLVSQLKDDGQRQMAFSGLEAAHQELSRSTTLEKAERDAHATKASEYGTLLTKLVSVVPKDRDGLSAMVGKLLQQHAIAQAESNDELRKQRLDHIYTTMEAVVAGLKKLVDDALPAIKELEEKEPEDYESPAHQAWEKKSNELKMPYMLAKIELNRARFMYYKMLPAEETKKRADLLKLTVAELDEVIEEFPNWGPTIQACSYSASACMEAKEYDKAAANADAGIELIKSILETTQNNKELAAQLAPYRSKLEQVWWAAMAKAGQFEAAMEKLRNTNDVEVLIGHLEFWLIKEQAHLGKKEDDLARAAGREADKIKAQLSGMSDTMKMRVDSIIEVHRGGTSETAKALKELEGARKRNDVSKIIYWSLNAISSGELKAEKKRQLYELLAYTYWQDRRYLETYTTYRYLSSIEKNDEAATKYSSFAVMAIQKMAETSKTPADRLVLESIQNWQRANFDVPGKEYEDAKRAKDGGRFKEAIDLFKKVPADSIHGETAAQQIGECYVLLARQELTRTKNADEAWKLADQGRQVLTDVLKKVNEPSQIPRVVQRRKSLRSAILHRLAVTDLWEGHEDYKQCLERTNGFLDEYPDLGAYMKAHVTMLRIRSLVALDRAEDAANEMAKIEDPAADNPDAEKIRSLMEYAQNLVFSAFSKLAETLDAQAKAKLAEAEKEAAPDKKAELKKQADELTMQSNAAGDKALAIISQLIVANPDQPFDSYWFLICELDRKGRANEVLPQLQAFLKKYGNDPKLTKKQKENVKLSRTMLGISQYNSGQYKEAIDVLTKELEGDKEEDGSGYYWQKKIYIARAKKELAKEDPTMAPVAVDDYLFLRKKLKEGTDDWWDVSVSLLEIRNIQGQYADNTFTVKRTMETHKALGNSAIRQRYMVVLASAKEKALKEDQQKMAAQLLADIMVAEVESNAAELKYGDLIKTLKQFEMFLPDYGGDEKKAKIKAIIEQVIPKVEGQIKTEAETILRNVSR